MFKRERPTATTVDEVLRWAAVHAFQRTANADTQLNGVKIAKGERVGLFYSSANYDEDVFDDPFSFNILRDPNPHLAFGGNGAHFCIGANLARMELGLIFNAIADVMPDVTRTKRDPASALGMAQRREGSRRRLRLPRRQRPDQPTQQLRIPQQLRVQPQQLWDP